MKNIIVVSDTHGNISALNAAKTLFDECDYIIHVGDGETDLLRLCADYKSKLIAVSGNCDAMHAFPRERVFEVESVKIFISHGDLYGVKKDVSALVAAAKANGCRVAIYGHTHAASVSERDGVLVINPGNVSRYSTKKSLCYLGIVGDKAVAKLNCDIFAGK